MEEEGESEELNLNLNPNDFVRVEPSGSEDDEDSSGEDAATGDKSNSWDPNSEKVKQMLYEEDDNKQLPPARDQDTGTAEEEEMDVEAGSTATTISARANLPLVGEAKFEAAMSSTRVVSKGVANNTPKDLYTSIRESRVKKYEAADLYGTSMSSMVLESFRNLGDDRYTVVKELNIMASKQNVRMSFDPDSMSCSTCPSTHPVGKRGENKKPVFVISDQCFPPRTT